MPDLVKRSKMQKINEETKVIVELIQVADS